MLKKKSETGSPWGDDIVNIMGQSDVVSTNLETTIIPTSQKRSQIYVAKGDDQLWVLNRMR